MYFDRKLLIPTFCPDGQDTFFTFLAERRVEVTFYTAEEEDFAFTFNGVPLSGDFNKPLAVAIEFVDGDVIFWDPWDPNAD